MTVFVREYKLYIGYLKELDVGDSNRVAGTGTPVDKSFDLRTVPRNENFLLFENHQFTAQINYPREGSSGKNPQQVIEIINPTKKTAAYVRTGNVVLLEAGYRTNVEDQELPIICATQIIRSTLYKRGENTFLKIICADAYKVKREVRINRNFEANRTYASVIREIGELLGQYGIPSVLNVKDLEDRQIKSSMAFANGLFDALDDILKPINYRWRMNNGVLYVNPDVEANPESYVRVLQIEEENVKNFIEELQDTSTKNIKESKDNGKGIRVRINLNGHASDMQALRVNFGDRKGQYRITSVKHVLDYEGQPWDTILECVKL